MLRRFFILLNILAVIVLFLSCLAGYINPNDFWQLSFFGFGFPVVLVVNFLFLLGWIIKKDRVGLITLFAIALSLPFIQNTFAFHFREANKEAGIKLMTWNVKNFDLYNWSHNRQTRAEMMAFIEHENPDVICLQEFYTNNQLFHNLEFLRDTLGYKYAYFPASVASNKLPKSKLQETLWQGGVLHQEWGVATFSKYHIADKNSLEFDNSFANNCIYTDLEINGKTLRLFNVHFQSIHLGYDDYAALDSLTEKQQTRLSSLKNIARKMKRAYTKRAIQAEEVATALAAYTGPKILCGDFNDVPVSYTYKTARGNMKDAFIENGSGFGSTYVNPFSIFRIDYVLHGAEIDLNSYRRPRVQFSDHYPVCVTFDL